MAEVETCPHGHPRTRENTYVQPVTGYRECGPCKAAARARRKPSAERPSTPQRAPKLPLDPALVAGLRSAAGLPSERVA